MSWVDLTSIVLDLLTLVMIGRATREIKSSLSDARHERLDINRRLEVLSRRVDKHPPSTTEDAETSPVETLP